MHAVDITKAYPKSIYNDRELVARCIEACADCSQACTSCADACLSEDSVRALIKCIRSNLDCADVCDASGRVLSRHTAYDANVTRAVLDACAQVCKSCGDICAEHAGEHEHCRICAEACRHCERTCQDVISAI